MTTVSRVSQMLQTLVWSTANRLGCETGFIQGQGKVTGALFVQTLLCGWLCARDATLALLVNTGQNCGLTISPQGLDERFSDRAASFLRVMLDAALTTTISTAAVSGG